MPLTLSRPNWPLGMMYQPPLVAGRFYAAPQCYMQIATTVPGTSWNRIIPWLQPHSATWATIGIEVTAAGGAGRIAYYQTRNPFGVAELVRDFGTVAVDGIAFQSLTVNENVPAGLWLIGLFHNASSSPTLRSMIEPICQYGFTVPTDASPGNHLSWDIAMQTQYATLGAPSVIRLESSATTTPRVLIGV